MSSNPSKRSFRGLILNQPFKRSRNTATTEETSERLESTASLTALTALTTPSQNSGPNITPSLVIDGPNSHSNEAPSRPNAAKFVFKEILRSIVNVTDFFPPLKSAAAGIFEIMERYDVGISPIPSHKVIKRGVTEYNRSSNWTK